MRRLWMVAVLAIATAIFTVPAWAGSPHFVDSTVSATNTDGTLTVSGKEAGLGDELQVHIVVTATALCINRGGNHPKAVNKEDVSTAADFSLTLTATFQPPCSPPMTVEYTNVTVTDTTNDISVTLNGTF